MSPDDVQLCWSRFLEGDDKSLETIYRNYFDDLYSYGLKWLGDRHIVEDVIQDLFVKLMRNRRNLGQAVSVKFYLFRSFKNIALDKLRARKHGPPEELSHQTDFDSGLTADHSLIAKEEDARLRSDIERALAELTTRQREALILRYMFGFSYPEIAEILGLSQKGAYKLMARALDAMRHQMLPCMVLLLCAAKPALKYF